MKSNEFRLIKPEEMKDNVFELMDKDWMLITAGTYDNYNCMTASWGGMGILWKKPVAFVFIRPNRYTYEFAENSQRMSLSFFPEKYRDVLNLCGTKSGREIDKMHLEGITPMISGEGTTFFEEARMVIFIKKLYAGFIDKESVLEQDIHKLYNGNDYHKMYIGEIEKVMVKG
jgi:flavin reductase (DIM6/NTAB) family NADH-FMN oxidoreductase RutF